jgi:hypothetical protein
MTDLCILFLADLCVCVGYFDVQLGSTENDFLSLHTRNIVCDLSTVRSVVHHKEINIINIVNHVFLESVWKHVASALV